LCSFAERSADTNVAAQTNGTGILEKYMFPYGLTLGCFHSCTCTFTKRHHTAAMQGTSQEPMHTAQVGCRSTPGETLNGPPSPRRKEKEVRPSTNVEGSKNNNNTSHTYD
jgi:hypothetical protein